MFVVSLDAVNTEHPTEFSAFASDIGLTAAYLAHHDWPAFIAATRKDGEGFLFNITGGDTDSDGDLTAMHYRTRSGMMTLTIWND